MILHVCAIACFAAIFGPSCSAVETVKKLPEDVKNILQKYNISDLSQIINGTRRIIRGSPAERTMPYMVYLKLPSNSVKYQQYRRWLCGGVIVHEEYILTSAACIEDAKHFYVVSGTYKHREENDRFNNMCIKNGAKKAIWKCIPRNYVFDGHENDNIRWMNNDIAVVKLEDEFDFTRRVRGCDFVPKPICYNNVSIELEKPGNLAMIAGWGSTDYYNDWVNTRRQALGQAQVEFNMDLLMTYVVLVSKERCKRRWGKRYENIIENYMICSKDTVGFMSEICSEKYVDCTDVNYSGSGEEDGRRLSFVHPNNLTLHSPYHNDTRRNVDRQGGSGGFCENDHGGPLIYGEGVEAVVIGIISACLVKDRSNKCYGPFLYTSVFKNKMLLDCAIYKQTLTDCKKAFRSSETHDEYVISWVDHPDGPAKSELAALRRAAELNESLYNITKSPLTKTSSKVQSHLNQKPSEKKVTENKTQSNDNQKPSVVKLSDSKPVGSKVLPGKPQNKVTHKPGVSRLSEDKPQSGTKVTEVKPDAKPLNAKHQVSQNTVRSKATEGKPLSHLSQNPGGSQATKGKAQSNASRNQSGSKATESSSKPDTESGPATKNTVKHL